MPHFAEFALRREEAAVDLDDLTVDEGGLVGREEDDQVGDLFGGA